MTDVVRQITISERWSSADAYEYEVVLVVDNEACATAVLPTMSSAKSLAVQWFSDFTL